MHGHIPPLNAGQLNLYYAAAAERAESAKRALEVRRKLLGQPVLLEEDEYRVSEREPDGQPERRPAKRESAEGEAGEEPISMWA